MPKNKKLNQTCSTKEAPVASFFIIRACEDYIREASRPAGYKDRRALSIGRTKPGKATCCYK